MQGEGEGEDEEDRMIPSIIVSVPHHMWHKLRT